MSWLKRILTVVSYVAVAGGPVLAATGVGVPIGAALGAIGVASGAWLHFLDAPGSAPPVAETVDVAKAVASAVKKP